MYSTSFVPLYPQDPQNNGLRDPLGWSLKVKFGMKFLIFKYASFVRMNSSLTLILSVFVIFQNLLRCELYYFALVEELLVDCNWQSSESMQVDCFRDIIITVYLKGQFYRQSEMQMTVFLPLILPKCFGLH